MIWEAFISQWNYTHHTCYTSIKKKLVPSPPPATVYITPAPLHNKSCFKRERKKIEYKWKYVLKKVFANVPGHKSPSLISQRAQSDTQTDRKQTTTQILVMNLTNKIASVVVTFFPLIRLEIKYTSISFFLSTKGVEKLSRVR